MVSKGYNQLERSGQSIQSAQKGWEPIPPPSALATVFKGSVFRQADPPALPEGARGTTHMPPMVTVAQVRSEKAGAVSVALLAGRM